MRILIVLGILGVAALDWAALHDILKANEPSLWMEWTMLGASVPLFAGLARAWAVTAR